MYMYNVNGLILCLKLKMKFKFKLKLKMEGKYERVKGQFGHQTILDVSNWPLNNFRSQFGH